MDTDLSQLLAIYDYEQARADVAAKQQMVVGADLVLLADRKGLDLARAAARQAENFAATAGQRLQELAIAAYIGLGYDTPAAGLQMLPGGYLGTVSTPGGLSATQANEAQVMLGLVGKQERKDVDDSQHQVKLAEKAVADAAKKVQGAANGVAGAEAALVASRQSLAVMTEAATTPGLAATMDLPGPQGAPGSSTSPAGSSPARTGVSTMTGVSTTTAASTTTGVSATTTPAPAATQLPGAVNASVSMADPSSPSILGTPVMTAAELAAWFASTGHKANVTVPMDQLAADYQAAGKATGVRDDLAFAQSIVETDYFSFPSYGQLTGKDNNFAGIGACDSCATGWKFPTAADGVGAQLELLEAFASTQPVKTPLLPVNVGVGGCCQTWVDLTGTWATSLDYGISIMTVYHQMLTWVIPERLIKAGLLKPPPATGPASLSKGIARS